jgi:hypothetical protein
MQTSRRYGPVAALLLASCVGPRPVMSPQAGSAATDAAVYFALRDSLYARFKAETLLVAESTLVFRVPDPSYRPPPAQARLASISGRVDSVRRAWWRRLDSLPAPLLRQLAEVSVGVRSSSELSLPEPTRLIGAAELREIFREGVGEGWSEFARRYPRARRYSAFSPVAYSADRRSAALYYEFHCGGLCGEGNVVLLALAPDGRWHVKVVLQLWVS